MPFQPEILWGAEAIALLAALIHGVIQYRTRNQAIDPVSDAANPSRTPKSAIRENAKRWSKPLGHRDGGHRRDEGSTR